MSTEYQVFLNYTKDLSDIEINDFVMDLWTDGYIYDNNFYTCGTIYEKRIGDFIVGSEAEISDFKAKLVNTLIPFLKSLEMPYLVKSFELYEWDYSNAEIEEPTFLETYNI